MAYELPSAAGGTHRDSGIGSASSAAQLIVLGGLLAAVPVVIGIAVAPWITLIACGGAAVVVVAARRLDLALLLVLATLPLEAAFVSSTSTVTVTKVAGALGFGSFLLHYLIRRRPLHFEQSHAVVFGLFVVALFSSLQAFDLGIAIVTTLRYASFAVLYFMLTQVATDTTFQRRAVWVLTLSASVSAVLGLEQYFSGEEYYATLPYENQNDFAFILVTTIPIAGWLFVTSRWLARAALLSMIAVMLLAVVLSFSRGAMVGLAAALVLALVSERRRALIALGVVLVGLVAFWGILKTDPDRFETSFAAKEKVADSNVSSRLDAWVAALSLGAEHPGLGVGPGNFRHHFFEATGRTPGTENLFVVHNAYLDVLAELGVVGFLLFVAYVVLVYSRARACDRQGRGPPGLAFSLRLSLAAAFAASLTLSEQYFGPIWVLGGLATAMWLRSRTPEGPQPRFSHPPPA